MMKTSGRAWFISQRSGMKFPYNEMIREPGTGYLIHKSESDGEYNYVDHPQGNLHKYVKYGDPFPLENAIPDENHVVDLYLTDEDGNTITDERGNGIELI